jgi:NAD(P)-dependent dehydrogenase (short-subunit alcohol dehydrogenase family)
MPRTAIVTASDSGIGKATAVALARDGLDVGITFHDDEEGAQGTAEEVRALGRKAVVRQLDLAHDLPAGAAVIDELADELGGRLWAFVSNAGGGTSDQTFLELPYDVWRHDVALNLDGAFVALQAGAKRMTDGAGGRLVAITSVHEHTPRVTSGPYVAAKHGLGGLVKNAAQELAQLGITVNAVAPGEISTPLTGQADVDPSTQSRPGVPLGRPGSAHEIAAAVAFLCRDEAGYITGVSLPVDGGMLLQAAMGASGLPDDTWRQG